MSEGKVAELKLCFKNLTVEIALKEALTEELFFSHELIGSFAIDFKGQRIGP